MTWTSPRTWVAGETVDEVLLNEQVRDNFKAIGDAMASYTPTLTNVTLGTGGTVSAAAMQVGKFVRGHILITLGTGGALAGIAGFTLPSTPLLSGTEHFTVGTCSMFDTSANAVLFGAGRWTSTVGGGSVIFSYNNTTATGALNANATAPWTWAAGDRLWCEFDYEAA